MIYHLGGLIIRNGETNEAWIRIRISEEGGQPLLEQMPIVLKEYGKYITGISLIGDAQDQHELIAIFKQARKAGLKTCFETKQDELSKINLKLLNELDIVTLNGKKFIKEYSPLDDAEDWFLTA